MITYAIIWKGPKENKDGSKSPIVNQNLYYLLEPIGLPEVGMIRLQVSKKDKRDSLDNKKINRDYRIIYMPLEISSWSYNS